MDNQNPIPPPEINFPTHQTRNFLGMASQGKNSWWRYILSFIVIMFAWQIIGSIPYAIVLLGGISDNQLLTYLALSFSFICLLIGIIASVKFIHKRKPLTLITTQNKISLKNVFVSFVVWSMIVTIITIIDALLHPGSYQLTFDWKAWSIFLPVALILTPIQTSAEEILFRGYFLQALGRFTQRKWLLILISGIIFAVPHFLNPEMAQGFALLAFYYFSFGAVLTLISLQSNHLEYALGVHAANNLITVLMANYTDSAIPSPSVFTAYEVDPVFNLLSFIAGSILLWLLLFKIFPKFGWMDD
jgi:hypothetical protein